MLLLDNILYLHNADLQEYGINPNTIERFESIRNPENKQERLYAYDFVYNRSAKCREKLPNKEKLLAQLIESTTLAKKEELLTKELSLIQAWSVFLDPMDTHWFQTKLNQSKASNIGKKTRDLSTCMAILRLMDNCKTKSEVVYITGFASKEELILALGNRIKEQDIYGLPASYDRLRVKYYEYKKMVDAGTDPRYAVIPGTFGNKNPQLLTEEHKAIINFFYFQPHKPSKLNTYERYVEQCTLHNMIPVSLSRVTEYLNGEFEKTVGVLIRDGKQAFEVQKGEFAHRISNYSLSLITGDGWQAGHPVTHTILRERKDGKVERVTVTGRMTVWIWFDWHSKAIISHEISGQENAASIRKSFRNAIRIMGGKIPMSVMMDKRWALNPFLKQTFDKLGVSVQDKRAYNPKSNMAERNNKEVNKYHRALDEHWANMTNGHSADNRHNPEHNRTAQAFTLKEFQDLIHQVIALYNTSVLNSLKATPVEVLFRKINPEVRELDEFQKRWAFGNTRVESIKNGTFSISINKKEYEYQVPNWTNFLKMNIKNNKVKVYFDEDFMESVDIYRFEDEKNNDNDLYIATCQTVEAFNALQVEQSEKDKVILGQLKARQHELEESIYEIMDNTKEKIEKLTGYEGLNVVGVSQERHKKALDNEFMKLYKNITNDFDETDYEVVTVAEKTKKTTLEQKKKHYDPAKMKNIFNDTI